MAFARRRKELINQLFTLECQRLPSLNMHHQSEAKPSSARRAGGNESVGREGSEIKDTYQL